MTTTLIFIIVFLIALLLDYRYSMGIFRHKSTRIKRLEFESECYDRILKALLTEGTDREVLEKITEALGENKRLREEKFKQ